MSQHLAGLKAWTLIGLYIELELLMAYFDLDKIYDRFKTTTIVLYITMHVVSSLHTFFRQEHDMEYEDVLARRQHIKNDIKKTMVLTGFLLLCFVVCMSF